MKPSLSRRLLHTTAFRTALVYACVFGLLSALGLGFIYWSTKSHIESQVDARLRLEANVLIDQYNTRALPALINTIRQRNDEDGGRSIFFYLLWQRDQGWLAGRPPTRLQEYRKGRSPIFNADHNPSYTTVRLGDVFQVSSDGSDDWVRVLTAALPEGYQLLVGRDLNDEKRLLEHTLTIILVVVGVIFLFALAGSVIMGRSALRRIDAISRTAGEIMAGDLSKRLPLSEYDNEFDELSRKLNAMLERIEQLLAGMRQVTDNVAHDLRKPLNRLRSRLEVTLLEARCEEEYRCVMEQGIHDADELLKTFSALLSIAQAEAGVKRNEWSPVELASLAEDLADLYEAVAEEKNIRLIWTADPSVQVQGNRQLLAQAIGNLLDNAVKYTPQGGRIELWALKKDGVAIVTVADSGPGIPEPERERALQRFNRLDSARSEPGSGLGLSLVKAVARLHGAELKLEDNNPAGLRVSLRFSNSG
jgi:signal transduction histidine kinase